MDAATEFKQQADTNDSRPPYAFLTKLEATIRDRLDNPSEDSYVSKLSARGYSRVLQKVGEEAVEVVLAGAYGDGGFKAEVADLLFHTLIALQKKKIGLQEIVDILESRDKPRAPLPVATDAVTLKA